jgi:hypothetical protein
MPNFLRTETPCVRVSYFLMGNGGRGDVILEELFGLHVVSFRPLRRGLGGLAQLAHQLRRLCRRKRPEDHVQSRRHLGVQVPLLLS